MTDPQQAIAICQCAGKREPCCCDSEPPHCWWCGKPFADEKPAA
jgi:hypothetical protein